MEAGGQAECISIHTLRMEGDRFKGDAGAPHPQFQSTPSAWRVTLYLFPVNFPLVFQSTPSAWRVTSGSGGAYGSYVRFQSTPSAWRVTQDEFKMNTILNISIHTLRMEGDVSIAVFYLFFSLFQSTPSAWRVTVLALSDDTAAVDFNPHPPRGG